MYLFLDTLSLDPHILLFDETREVIDVMQKDMHHKEFELLPECIDTLLRRNELSYEQLSGIIVINGPGGFTGTRVTCLIANTIAFAKNIPLYPIDYFTFLHASGADYPYLIQANKREARILASGDKQSSLVSIDELSEESYSGTGNREIFENMGIGLYTDRDYQKGILSLDISNAQKQIHPIYIKDPNITLPKKHVTRL